MENIIFKFLKELRANNSRDWLQCHKEEYDRVMSARNELAQAFIDLIAEVDPQVAIMTPKDCTYRLMRDTRFSEDKTPYKTHIGIFVCPPFGKKSLLSGYYLHLEPGASMFCAGNYCLPTKYLTAIRNDICSNIDEYLGIVESPEFKEQFATVGSDLLKTAPKGFDRDWEYINYVRPRDFGVIKPLADSLFDNKDFISNLRPMVVQGKRLNNFINFALTESGLPLIRQ